MVATLTFLPFILNGSITTLTSLDFLGFGLPPGSPSLGELLRPGQGQPPGALARPDRLLRHRHHALAPDLHRRSGARRLRSRGRRSGERYGSVILARISHEQDRPTSTTRSSKLPEDLRERSRSVEARDAGHRAVTTRPPRPDPKRESHALLRHSQGAQSRSATEADHGAISARCGTSANNEVDERQGRLSRHQRRSSDFIERRRLTACCMRSSGALRRARCDLVHQRADAGRSPRRPAQGRRCEHLAGNLSSSFCAGGAGLEIRPVIAQSCSSVPKFARLTGNKGTRRHSRRNCCLADCSVLDCPHDQRLEAAEQPDADRSESSSRDHVRWPCT